MRFVSVVSFFITRLWDSCVNLLVISCFSVSKSSSCLGFKQHTFSVPPSWRSKSQNQVQDNWSLLWVPCLSTVSRSLLAFLALPVDVSPGLHLCACGLSYWIRDLSCSSVSSSLITSRHTGLTHITPQHTHTAHTYTTSHLLIRQIQHTHIYAIYP